MAAGPKMDLRAEPAIALNGRSVSRDKARPKEPTPVSVRGDRLAGVRTVLRRKARDEGPPLRLHQLRPLRLSMVTAKQKVERKSRKALLHLARINLQFFNRGRG